MTFPLGRSVTLVIRTATGRDADGNDVYTETPSTVSGCAVWPRNSSELVQGQDTSIVGLWLLLPAGTDATHVDAVDIDGVRYEVDGEPGAYVSPLTGTDTGTQVALTKVSG